MKVQYSIIFLMGINLSCTKMQEPKHPASSEKKNLNVENNLSSNTNRSLHSEITTLNTSSHQEIKINIPIDSTVFYPTATLTISIYNQEDIEVKNSHPTYKIQSNDRVQHETHNISLSEIRGVLELTTTHLKIGENYEIYLSGKSSDNCNMARSLIRGTVESVVLQLDNLQWSQTKMACISK